MSDKLKPSALTLKALQEAVAGSAAAFRCITEYQPAGGAGDKVFPPTYEGGKYAAETRIIEGAAVDCVLLDSVQSQANRMELALLEAYRAKKLTHLPLVVTRFDQESLKKKFSVTSLDAPHRIADAIFRDSLLAGVMFRKSEKGNILDTADVRNATGIFGLCPTALVFGLWDSAGPRGGLGAKFQRTMVSEVVGYHAVAGKNVSSRIDPLGVEKRSGPVFRTEDGSWTLDPDKAVKVDKKPALYGLNKGKLVAFDNKSDTDIPEKGRPSLLNHGNVTPDFTYAKDNGRIVYDTFVDEDGEEHRVPRIIGGFTVSKAVQTTVLSLAALRRLRFPLGGSAESVTTTDNTARTALAALGLAAATLARGDGDLRSRCQLFPQHQAVWQLLDVPGETPPEFSLTPEQAVALLNAAIEQAISAKLPWEAEIELTPSDELVELVRRSQELASASVAEVE